MLISRGVRVTAAIRRQWIVQSHVGISLAPTVIIGKCVDFKVTDGGRLDVGEGVAIAGGGLVVQKGEISIGARSTIGPWSMIVARDSIVIGHDCLIAERVTIRDQDHRIHGDPEIPMHSAGTDTAPIRIGDNVWIAAGAVVLKGTTIGDGAVVAANAVVRSVVPARAIVAGVPARIVGYRKFPE